MHASADGIVTNLDDLTGPGDPCHGGGPDTMRIMNCGADKCQSIPVDYVEAGVPVEGQTVQS